MTLVLVTRPEATTIGPVLAVVARQPLVLLVEAAHVPPHEWERMRRGLGLGDRGARHRDEVEAAFREAAAATATELAEEARAAGWEVVSAEAIEHGPRALDQALAGVRPAVVAACGWPGPPPPHLRDLAKRHGVPLIAF